MESAEHDLIKVFEDAFTSNKSRLKKWITYAAKLLDIYSNGKYERHWTPEDIIKEVITRVLEGKRKYNPDKYKSVDDFIFKTIRSLVDDEFSSRRTVLPIEKYVDSKDGGEFVNQYEEKHKTENDTIQKNFEIEEKLEECYQRLLENEDDALVFLEWKLGSTSKDIADGLGLELSAVESAKKRIRYKLTGGKKR